MRLHAQAATIENGFVFLPEEAPWLADYLAELLAFPAGRHDDQVELDRAGAGLGEAAAGGRGDARLLAAAGGGGVRVIHHRHWEARRAEATPWFAPAAWIASSLNAPRNDGGGEAVIARPGGPKQSMVCALRRGLPRRSRSSQ